MAIKSILQNGLWPPNMKYLTCDEYDGTNSPDHSIDLRSYFIDVSFWVVAWVFDGYTSPGSFVVE